VTIFHPRRVTILAMPPRIGQKTRQRVFLKQWREYKELSQEAVGGRFDPPVAKGTIDRLEDKPAHLITIGVLQEYAAALDLPHWTFLHRMPPPKDVKDPAELERTIPTLDNTERDQVLSYIAGMRARRAS
jgi:hypothetical protein